MQKKVKGLKKDQNAPYEKFMDQNAKKQKPSFFAHADPFASQPFTKLEANVSSRYEHKPNSPVHAWWFSTDGLTISFYALTLSKPDLDTIQPKFRWLFKQYMGIH